MSQRGTPAIACIGVIGRKNNPLHVSLFPPDARDSLEFQFLLTTSLDIFEARLPQKTADHDFGLLQAIDERLAMYGWLTNTGIKFVIIVDMEGRPVGSSVDEEATRSGNGYLDANASGIVGLRDSDFKPAFRALHAAYIRLMKNPFFDPDDCDPSAGGPQTRLRNGRTYLIQSSRFISDVKRIGRSWYPGIGAI